MDLIIKNGKIVTGQKSFIADIAIEKGIIKSIGPGIDAQAKETIDASGMLILPGVIDAHVHFQLPAGGTVSCDDFENGTKAAACGGVTTIIDFAHQEKGHSLAEAIELRRAEANGRVAIDYSLHAAITDWNEKTRAELENIIAEGIPTFKMYMVYAKQGLMSDDAAIFSALEETSKFGGMVTVHAESAGVLDLLIARYHTSEMMSKYGAFCHPLSRPNFVEAEAVGRAVTWAEGTGGRLYIVHLTTARGANIVHNAKLRGVKVHAETCPHYLLLDDSVFQRPDGYLYATCPPIRKKADSERLWAGLLTGDIETAATDTCTFNARQKAAWNGDFTRIPYGLPGVETLLPLMYTYGMGRKGLTENQLVEILSEKPARLMGLYPTKGTIEVGADADLVVFDPNREVKLSHKNLQTNCDWSPYEGFELTGYPHLTISRGEIIARQGKFVGKAGHGRFVSRGRIMD